MQDLDSPLPVPSIRDAQWALAELATQDALTHLEAALRSMQSLSSSLQKGDRLPAAEKRTLERELLRFRSELRDATVLAERGLAYCQDWAQQWQSPTAYQSNGTFATGACERHELSLEA